MRFKSVEAHAGLAAWALTHFDKVYWRGGYYQSTDIDYPNERANAMAVVTGLADEAKWPAIYENVLSKKLNPHWEGGNTYNASSYFERWIMESLCKMGKQEFALLRMYDRYQDQIRVHTTTLWEHFGRWWETRFDANSSQNHGWNSPNTVLSRCIAGVAPEAPAWSTYHVRPKEAFLTAIRVVVPTVKGDVAVRIDKNLAILPESEVAGRHQGDRWYPAGLFFAAGCNRGQRHDDLEGRLSGRRCGHCMAWPGPRICAIRGRARHVDVHGNRRAADHCAEAAAGCPTALNAAQQEGLESLGLRHAYWSHVLL
ncbi:MAG TPA: hypothetical protein P5279_12950 [Anaerohalosphaeraceae bacterium]|jgi:hypothetical protein|nr:hypothetical protein [Anaerohalosphaeraceae bacterium]HRT51396.1 hypothetical protein [Anaerohalosphaeraceae bacterium]HRT87289.1 hypothetical protein [Anaerohalosphaeraceae bacterium]